MNGRAQGGKDGGLAGYVANAVCTVRCMWDSLDVCALKPGYGQSTVKGDGKTPVAAELHASPGAAGGAAVKHEEKTRALPLSVPDWQGAARRECTRDGTPAAGRTAGAYRQTNHTRNGRCNAAGIYNWAFLAGRAYG